MGRDCWERFDWPTGWNAGSGFTEADVGGREGGAEVPALRGVGGLELSKEGDFELLEPVDNEFEERFARKSGLIALAGAVFSSSSSSLSSSSSSVSSTPFGYSSHASSTSSSVIGGRFSSWAARVSKQYRQCATVAMVLQL